MHAVGRLFPRGDRAPAIEPIRPAALAPVHARRTHPATPVGDSDARSASPSGFYLSQALELTRP